MSIVMDIILIVIAALIIFRCWRNGLVKSVIGIVCDVVALVVAYTLTPRLADWMCNTVFLDRISSGIDATVRSAAEGAGGVDVGKFVTSIPDTLAGTLSKYGIGDDALKEFIRKDVHETGEGAVKAVSDFIAKPTSQIISNAISFILIFVVALVLLRLVSLLIVKLFKAPIIKTADRTAGLILGVVNALFIVWVLSLAISVGTRALGSYIPSWFANTTENSIILKFFSRNNPVTVLKNVLERVNV